MTQHIDIDKLLKLSKLTLSEEETLQAEERLKGLLKLMENLKELDLKDVEPMIADTPSVLREDIPLQSFSAEQAFMNAPQEENSFFAIPKVIA